MRKAGKTLDEMRKIADAIKYKGWVLLLQLDKQRSDAPYLQWQFHAIDAKTGASALQSGRKWYLSPHMTISEIVQTAFKAALTAEEHECREHFSWEGVRVFNPHINVRALSMVADMEDARE